MKKQLTVEDRRKAQQAAQRWFNASRYQIALRARKVREREVSTRVLLTIIP